MIDLSIIEAAARVLEERLRLYVSGLNSRSIGWGASCSEIADVVLAASLPLIESAIRTRIAEEIESHGARRKSDNRLCGLMTVEFAGRIARGPSPEPDAGVITRHEAALRDDIAAMIDIEMDSK